MNKEQVPPQERVATTTPILHVNKTKKPRGRPRKIIASSVNEEDEENHQLTMSYRTIIAANMKRLREQLGLRQKDLAKLMATSQGQITSLEVGRISVGLHTLTRLATALQVEPPSLLLPYTDPGTTVESDAAHLGDVAPPLQNKTPPGPEQLAGTLAVGVNLTTVKEIVAATHKRLEDLERRHGSVPMTREMLTSVLVTVLNASQNMDSME